MLEHPFIQVRATVVCIWPLVQRRFVIALVMDIIVHYAIAIVISHDNDICFLIIFLIIL